MSQRSLDLVAGRLVLVTTLLVVTSFAMTLDTPAGASSAPQSAPLEVRDVLAAAFPTELTAAADGSAVAWVLDELGARNIWVAEAPGFTGRRLTAYTRDDGQVISALQFAGAGTLVFVRGGAPNRAGDIPNPLSYAGGASRAVYKIARGSGEAEMLGTGSGPIVSPAGDSIVYSSGGKLHHLDLVADDSGEAATARVVLDVRGGIGGVRFSPTGDRLAFVSRRGTHALIGVVDLAPGSDEGPNTVTWLDPSVDTDRSPVWSPDGERIAFVREPARHGGAPFAPRRTAAPWSIRVASTSGGSSDSVFTVDEGPGSVLQGVGMPYNPSAAGGLVWGADERIAFPWEKTGWRGMYSVPVVGGDVTAVAVGDFEVETAARSADGRALLISSNQDDIDRRHIWRVPIDGSAVATRLTDGRWIEWSPVQVGDGLAYLRSNATTPAHAVIRPAGESASKVLAAAAIPADYPSDRLVEPQPVTVNGADGMPIHAQLFLPPDLKPGERRPAAIFFHGGSRRQMLLGFHYSNYYHNAYALSQVFASRGYIAMAVNYRSGIGYGMEFREALNYGATGGSEFQDVLGAGLYLRGRDDVDPHRIGLWGGSYGGYLTAMGLSRASDLFAVGVDLHGVHDWNEGIRIFNPGYDPDEDTERLAFESSPNASLDTWRSPVLLIHGDDDRNVFFSQTVRLVEALRDRQVHVEQLVFPDEVHGFLRHESWARAYEAAVEFFERMLHAASAP